MLIDQIIGKQGKGNIELIICPIIRTLAIKYLNEEEMTFLLTYVETVGESDSISQIKFVEGSEKYLENKEMFSAEEYKKYKNLYIKIGILIGLIMFIALL